MSTPLILALFWCILANVTGMFPSRRKHWPQAYVLIALGLPLLGWVFREDGIVTGLVVLAAAASILRWPLRHLFRWVKRRLGLAEAPRA